MPPWRRVNAVNNEEIDEEEVESEGEYEEEGEYTEEEEEDGQVDIIEDEDEGPGPGPDDDAIDIAGLQEVQQTARALRAHPEVHQRPAKEISQTPTDWTDFGKFPAATKQALQAILKSLEAAGRSSLTVLLLGKAGVGKSSTFNALLNESEAAKVFPLNPPGEPNATVALRQASTETATFTLCLLEAPSLLEADQVSQQRVSLLKEVVGRRALDAVLLVDRLDTYRVDASDRLLFEAVTEALGVEIWDRTIVGLTHANLTALVAGMEYGEMVSRRETGLLQAIRASSGNKTAALPVALIDNSSRCPVNAQGEKKLPNETPWLRALFEQVADVALSNKPYVLNSKAVAKRADPNKKWRWLIPLLLVGQYLLKVRLMDPLLERDGWQGDQYGPYDPDFQQEEKARQQQRKLERQRRAERDRLRRRRRELAGARGRAIPKDDSSDDDDF